MGPRTFGTSVDLHVGVGAVGPVTIHKHLVIGGVSSVGHRPPPGVTRTIDADRRDVDERAQGILFTEEVLEVRRR